jgi:amphi-Trp domain-containing protein
MVQHAGLWADRAPCNRIAIFFHYLDPAVWALNRLWPPRLIERPGSSKAGHRLKGPTGMKNRDIEKTYPTKEFVAKLRRFADSLEAGKNFEIQVAGERIYVPNRARFSIEHEREDGHEELEFQIKWTND